MKPKGNRSRPEREKSWAAALHAASRVTRKAAFSEADVLVAVTDELSRLHLHGSVALLTENNLLEVKSQSTDGEIESTLQRLANREIDGYRFDPAAVDAYREVLSTGESIFTTDRASVIKQMMPKILQGIWPRIIRLLGQHPLIIAPLILADKPLGAINVSASWLTQDDVLMVSALADHIAIAIGAIRTRAKMQAALNRERLRNQVAESLASPLDLPSVLEHVIRLAVEVTNADAGVIGLIEPDGETIIYPYLFGFPERLSIPPSPKGKGFVWNLIESQEPLIIRASDQHAAFSRWDQAGFNNLLGVALNAGNEVIGGMGLFTTNDDEPFNQEQSDMAQAIASMAAATIKNARLYADTTRRAEESQALIRTARSISASLDQDIVLHLIAKEAKSLIRADASRIHLLDTTQGILRCPVAIGPDAEAAMSLELKPGQGLVGYVIEHGEPIIINDAAGDPRGLVIPGTSEDDPECLAIVPLSIRQWTMGAMTVRRIGLERPFTSSDLELLTAFAAQASVTLENAHLFGEIAAQAHRLEREVAERTQDLSRSESHYRALVETSLAGILQLDNQGRFVYVNQRFANMLELKPDELIGKSVASEHSFIPPEHQSALDSFNALLRGDQPSQDIHEINLVTKSGHRIPVILAASQISDEDGNPQGVTGLVIDISQQKMLEAALQAERDRLDALLTYIGDAVMVTDPNGVIEFVNPGWERLNGFSAAEALGKKPNLIKSGQHEDRFYDELWETISNGQTWRGEVINCRKDGTFYDAALIITPVLDETGQVINFVSVLHDISALKELDRLKSQFVSDVSHELRTPLTNIRLYLDLLERRAGNREMTSRYLETLSRESERLANLIDDLLSLSRLDADAVSFDPIPVDVNELLGELTKDRHTLAAKRGLRLSIEPDASVPTIIGDGRLLTQVFTNLLTNAMNYTPDGGKITLRTLRQSEPDGDWVVAEVEDTGLGIPSDEIQMIFHRFFRGSASQSTSAHGTGLGLAICKEIVERHGGRITVDSDGIPGHGSRFAVWLPLNSGR